MCNRYTSSAEWSIKSKTTSLSYSFNDCSNLLNERFDGNPFLSRCCTRSCSCCPLSFATQRVRISPRFLLYGLRQSTQIQWSPFRRRLILGSGDRFFKRFPSDDLDQNRCEVFCSNGERYGGNSRTVRRRRKERIRCMVPEQSRGCCDLGCLDNAEAVIDLLSEECSCGRKRSETLIQRVEGKKRGKNGDECFSDSRRRVELEKRANYENDRYTGRNKNGEGERRASFISAQYRGKEREEVIKKKFSGSGLLESDSRCESVMIESRGEDYRKNEDKLAQSKSGTHRGRTKSSSFSSYYSILSSDEFQSDVEDQDEDVRYVENSSNGHKGGGLFEGNMVEESRSYGNHQLGSGVDRDSRKKSEKRIVEVSNRESGKESSQMQSRRRTHEINHGESSSYQVQYYDEEEKSNSTLNLEQGRRQHNHIGNLSASGGAYKEDAGIHEVYVDDVGMKSQSQKHFSGREESTAVSVQSDANRENIRKRSQQLNERAEIQYTGDERISQLQRQSKYSNIQAEATSVTHNSAQELEEREQQPAERRSGQVDLRRKIDQLSNKSDREIKSTSVLQCESQIRNWEEHASLVSGSQSQVNEQHYRTEQVPRQKLYIELLEEASSSLSSLTSASPSRMQQVNLDEEETRRSQVTLMPPPSQLVNRSSQGDYQSVSQEESYGTSETGYDAAYTRPERRAPALRIESHGTDRRNQAPGELVSLISHEDALGSAHRSEQQSTQFIEEFVEKARHEASASETQEKERTESLKRQDSRRSSGDSGVKGPSDEIWITDPSVQEIPEAQAPEVDAAAGNAIAQRSGRSFWRVIADVVRLRWGLRAGSPDAAAKSPEKSSPNKSVTCEAWFSGHEHDGSSDDNVEWGRKIKPQEAVASHRLEVGRTSSQVQLEPGSMKLKQKLGRREVNLSSSPSRLDGGSASRCMSSLSSDQNVALNENSKSSQAPVWRTDAVETPFLVPSRSLRRSPVVKELSESSTTEVSGVREQVEQQPPYASSQEETGSPVIDSVLEQRKLQRNKQVVRDRFNEWEGAYKREAKQKKIDEIFMREALLEAKKAADIWEVPVGAVLVHNGKIVARGYNLVEELRDSTAHAEIICIREGSNVLRSWRLADTTLYVTLEPCPMCAGAILQARISALVYGTPNKLLGADGSWIRLFPDGEGNESEPSDKPPAPVHPFHPKMTIRRGILESECADAMQQFFQLRRKKEKNVEPSARPSCLPVSFHHPSNILNKMHSIFHLMFCL